MSVLEQLFLAVFEHKAPDNNLSNSVLAVKQAAAAAADTSIMMSQTAFRLSETHWMGRAIKYAGLHGIDVHVAAAHLVAEGDQPSTPLQF